MKKILLVVLLILSVWGAGVSTAIAGELGDVKPTQGQDASSRISRIVLP